MPSPAAAEALVGTVTAGLGEGAHFTGLDWAARAFGAWLGAPVHPGTFNLRLRGPAWRAAQARMRAAPGLPIEPPPGYCAAKCFRVRVDGRVDALAVVPDVAAYPQDKLELVAACALREALGVDEGARVALTVAT